MVEAALAAEGEAADKTRSPDGAGSSSGSSGRRTGLPTRLRDAGEHMHPDYDAAYRVEGIGGSVMPSVCDPRSDRLGGAGE